MECLDKNLTYGMCLEKLQFLRPSFLIYTEIEDPSVDLEIYQQTFTTGTNVSAYCLNFSLFKSDGAGQGAVTGSLRIYF